MPSATTPSSRPLQCAAVDSKCHEHERRSEDCHDPGRWRVEGDQDRDKAVADQGQ
jgi:hypothetical protein